jgi:hypothetical protein
VPFGPKKNQDFRPPPSSAPRNGFACLKTIKYKLHIKNRYIGNFMSKSLLAAVLCVVVCRCCYGGGEADLPSPLRRHLVCLQLCCVLLFVDVARPLCIYPSESAPSDTPHPTLPPMLLTLRLSPLSFSPSDSAPLLLTLVILCTTVCFQLCCVLL